MVTRLGESHAEPTLFSALAENRRTRGKVEGSASCFSFLACKTFRSFHYTESQRFLSGGSGWEKSRARARLSSANFLQRGLPLPPRGACSGRLEGVDPLVARVGRHVPGAHSLLSYTWRGQIFSQASPIISPSPFLALKRGSLHYHRRPPSSVVVKQRQGRVRTLPGKKREALLY